MIDVKKALYHAFRFTFPSDNMNYVDEEFNDKSVRPLERNPDLLSVAKFNVDYSLEIEEVLSDPVTLISSFFTLPNKFEPCDKSTWAKIKRIGKNIVGWKDTDSLWFNIICCPLFLIKNALVFIFMFPVNIVKVATEFLFLFLSNLCDQAEESCYAKKKKGWGMFFECLGVLFKILHFAGRAVTSPMENQRFYFTSAHDLHNRGLYHDAHNMACLGLTSLTLSIIYCIFCPKLIKLILLSSINDVCVEVSRVVGKWWRRTMDEPSTSGDEHGNSNDSDDEYELKQQNQNGNQYEKQNDYDQWVEKKNNTSNGTGYPSGATKFVGSTEIPTTATTTTADYTSPGYNG